MKEQDKFTVIYAEDHDLIAGIGVHENTLSSYNMHTHDCYELELITKGRAKHKLNNKTSVVSEGDLIFVTPMDIHSYEKLDDNFKILCIFFHLEHIDAEIPIHDLKGDITHCNDDVKFMIYMIKKEFESLYMTKKESEPKDKYSKIVMLKLLECILIFIRKQQVRSDKINVPRGIMDVIRYINNNFREPMDLEFICNKFFYSKAYFCRQFKKYTGVTFVVYLNNLRLVHAKNLLMHTKIPIVELCYECGFGSVRNFIREFKKKYNCTPGQIRKED